MLLHVMGQDEKQLISQQDWLIIESLIQNINLIANNLTSESF
jgi:hypothetical protein